MNTAVPDVQPVTTSGWDRVVDWTGSVRAIAVLRIALGPITLLHFRPFVRDVRRGVAYNDHFWHPYLSWFPELPGRAWEALIWIGVVAAVLMTLGVLTRLTTATTFTVVVANLLASTTHFHHNRAFLSILLAAVALLPSGRVLSVDAWVRRRAGRALPDAAPLWPLWLVRVQVCLVYLASGFSKLIDPDWIGGRVLWVRVLRHRDELDASPLPGWLVDLFAQRWVYVLAAPTAVAIELFVGVGLLVPRVRTIAIWVALLFHVMIEVTSSVQVFSLAAVAALAIWVRPSTREHEVVAREWMLRVVRSGDWFARFRLVGADPATARFEVRDRHGRSLTGPDAVLFVLARMPLTFPFAGPALAIRAVARSRARRQSSGSV